MGTHREATDNIGASDEPRVGLAKGRSGYFLKHNVADTTVTLQPVGGHEASAILRTIIAIPLLC